MIVARQNVPHNAGCRRTSVGDRPLSARGGPFRISNYEQKTQTEARPARKRFIDAELRARARHPAPAPALHFGVTAGASPRFDVRAGASYTGRTGSLPPC